jgi:hypothetical protein
MTQVSFPSRSFKAVVALYSIIHVPLDEQPELFRSIARWLMRPGFLLAIVGAATWTGIEHDWLGVPGATMDWNHAETETYRGWLRDLGFTVLRKEFVPEGSGGHTLVFLKSVPANQRWERTGGTQACHARAAATMAAAIKTARIPHAGPSVRLGPAELWC